MNLTPGDVVMLKSGGHPLTVAEVNQTSVVCLWMGEEGDLFRETLPLAVLEIVELNVADDEEDDEDEDHEHDDEEEDEHTAKVA
jgi:uncharacterized protein YodC (DUF2158 family)